MVKLSIRQRSGGDFQHYLYWSLKFPLYCEVNPMLYRDGTSFAKHFVVFFINFPLMGSLIHRASPLFIRLDARDWKQTAR